MADQKKAQIAVKWTPSTVKPLFADEVMLGIMVKSTKGKDGVRKEGMVRLGFIDMVRGQAVAEIVITPITAEGLSKLLNDKLKELDKELKSKKMPEKPIVKEDVTGYV